MNDYYVEIRHGIVGSENKIVKVADVIANCYNQEGIIHAIGTVLRKNNIAGKNVLEVNITRMDWLELDEV